MPNTIENTSEYQLFCQSRLSNPYPLYHRLRQEEPVQFSEVLQTWMLTNYEDVKVGLVDNRLSNDKMAFYFNPIAPKTREKLGSLTQYFSQWMNMKDPPDHTRLRGLVNKAFTPKSLEELTPKIQAISERLVGDLVEHGRGDVIGQFAYPLPATVICEMLGIPPDDQDQFRGWSADIIAFSAGSSVLLETVADKAQASQLELVEYCRRIISQRRMKPKDDLISRLISVEERGAQISELELYAMCVQLFVAGQETTTNLIGNGVFSLLKNPGTYQRLRERPDLIESAIEEFLRYESPVQRMSRIAREELEIHGKRIKEGQSVMLMIGAANRDPQQFPDPDQLILDRKPNRHLAFGRGPHFCIGAPLARREAKLALGTLLAKLTSIELVGDDYNWRPLMAMRGLESLEVVVSVREKD